MPFRSALLLTVGLFACAAAEAQADSAAVQLPALREDLLGMVAADTEVQQRIMDTIQSGTFEPSDEARRDSVFDANGARVRVILETHGWPGYRLVGEDGSHAAWLLVQHADRDTTLQRTALSLLGQAAASSQASGSDLAYLTDRLRLAEGRPQVYGTQLGYDARGCAFSKPSEDEAGLDARRLAVGLETRAAYLSRVMEQLGRAEVCAAP